jgi:glycosyltransferase involved in cell wall biosynthesis
MSGNVTRISIVTPTYNQGAYIEETICSVLDQQYPNLEYIIIDGGSTDHTVQIIKKYERFLKFWISEKDRGQAHAINKGMQYCTGEIFNWLNSDDYLEPDALNNIAAAFSNPQVHLVAGKVRTFSALDEAIIQNRQLTAAGLMCWKPGVQFVQPGVWMRRELISRCGGIDEQYHYAFDWDLYIRYLYHFPVVQEIDALLVHFRLHEQSKTQTTLAKFAEEERRIIEKIYALQGYDGLRNTCLYKMQKTGWTEFLSDLSKSDSSFFRKMSAVISNMWLFNKVSFSRQTAGALRAFWQGREI